MKGLVEYREAVEARIREWCAALPAGKLYEPMAYLLALPAKRVRPMAVLLSTELFGGDTRQAMEQALGVELFHNFTLMHDDIMDASPTRRGMATVHMRWNVNTAILSGDAMLVKAYEAIGTDPRVLRTFNMYALQVCEGQAMDMDFEGRVDVHADEYMDMIRRKTAVLLACALEVGAIIGGADEAQQRSIGRFGEKLGLAFQLRDDHIDAFGDPDVSGKQRGGDLRAGKKTWLLIRGLELEKGSGAITSAVGQLGPLRDVGAMIDALVELGVRDASEALIKNLEQEAIAELGGLDVPAERKVPLLHLARSLMGRLA